MIHNTDPTVKNQESIKISNNENSENLCSSGDFGHSKTQAEQLETIYQNQKKQKS